jgi:agmatine deiminase
MTRRMPAEGDPHQRLWLAWPTAGYTLGDTAEDAEEARLTWAAVANAAAEFEPVSVVVHPRDIAIAPRYLDGSIELHVREIDDAWIRDSGPTFVIDDGALAAVTWVFNGWGAQEWASWQHDRELAPALAEWAAAHRIDSSLVNEGGGIHVDGVGTVLVTETVQRDPGRNPGITREAVEAELARTLGTAKTIWLPRGLTRDSDTFGTRGHVDIVATFSEPGVVLLHDQRDSLHPDYAVSRELRSVLESESDAHGEPLRIIDLPAPATLRDDEGFVDYSYVNHVLVNGGVIACSFGDANDANAAAILAEAYPGRRVVPVDARPLFARGGGIHCITQQQPAIS